MHPYIKLICLLFISAITANSFAQDYLFLMPQAAPMTINPATAGMATGSTLRMNYMNQWPQISGNYVTSALALDHRSDSSSFGFGLLLSNDRAGRATLNTNSAEFMVSTGKKFDETTRLLFGAGLALHRKTIDWSQLTFGDMIDPVRGFIYETAETPPEGPANFISLDVGALFEYHRLRLGASAWHLNEPNESLIGGESRLPRRIVGQASYDFQIAKCAEDSTQALVEISPSVLYSRQGQFQFTRLGLDVNVLDRYFVGIFQKGTTSSSTWTGVNAGIQFGTIRVDYAFAKQSSDLTPAWGNAHSLNLFIPLGKNVKTRKSTAAKDKLASDPAASE